MDSSKDFAKSKRKATQRHTPGRGGRGFPGSKKSSAKAELGSNVERYRDEGEATRSAGPGAVAPRSQGADLTSLLQEQQTDFRQRGTFYDEVQPLPTTDSDQSTLDLNIDLQALASSLSSLPVWDVLDIDAALCKTHQPKKEHQSASINREHALDHTPAEGRAVQPNAAAAAHSRYTMTMHTHSEHDPTTDNSAESTSQVAASATAKATSSFASQASAAESVANMQTKPDAPGLSKQTPAAHHSASMQTGGDALNTNCDSDDLDALLNASSLSTKPQTASPSVSKPAPQEQDSLEDWLNSL